MFTSRLLFPLSAFLTALFPAVFSAQARLYPITKSDSSGTWVGTRRGLLHGTGELWKRFSVENGLPSSQITDVELSQRFVWVATPKGLAQLDKGSRRWKIFTTPQLPSEHVTAVSLDPSDPDHVWVSTTRGVAYYKVREDAWKRFGRADGLPSEMVHDLYFRGVTVWVATEAGLAAYNLKNRSWSIYTSRHGLAGDKVLEIEEQGNDLWLFCSEGLTRMQLQRRTFSPFRQREGLPSPKIQSQARAQDVIYIVTDKGLITYDTKTDSLAPFLYQKGLGKARVRSAASAGGFIWFATDQGLLRFDPTKKSWERYQIEDGLSNEDLREVTAVGNVLMIFGEKGELDTYDYKKDEWMERSQLIAEPKIKAPASQPAAAEGDSKEKNKDEKQTEQKKTQISVSAELETEFKQDLSYALDEPQFDREGYWKLNTLRLGGGALWPSGRSLDISGNIDWGDISPIFDGNGQTLKTFQHYDLNLRYLGKPGDPLREVAGSTQHRFEPEGGKLTESTELEGGRVVLEAGPGRSAGALANLHLSAGVRRGTPTRVVLRRPEVSSLKLKRFKISAPSDSGSSETIKPIIPSTVHVMLDGRELERNIDYFVDHENQVLWLKNTDLINTFSVLEVEYEYEQIPRKELGMVSMTDLLPKDGAIGQIKRSGQARWAKDEQGLFDEIDGGAEQYINRGWKTTLSQDYEWGSAGIILRIHDMDEGKNAQSILLVRKLPDAKKIPDSGECYLERQSTSLSVKCASEEFYIEISIDQASMEQEILSLAGWLISKLSIRGSTAADNLRDVILSSQASLKFTDEATLGVSYLGSRSMRDEELERQNQVEAIARDLIALNGAYAHRFSENIKLHTRFQAAASSAAEGDAARLSGNGLYGQALLVSPKLMMSVTARKYSKNFSGIGPARQTEFCRAKDGQCNSLAKSRMDHELDLDATLRAVDWLPLNLGWQRQSTLLGEDYTIPKGENLFATRDVARARLSLDVAKLPKLSVGAGYIRRDDLTTLQHQLRGTTTLEADLAERLFRSWGLKKLYLRGLYEYGVGQTDELVEGSASPQDRDQSMHHLVGELRFAPTLTSNGYAQLEYHQLRGVRDADGAVVDRLTFWRFDAGAGSSAIPGLALRFDTTLWFDDDQPLIMPDSLNPSPETSRAQSADSTLSGVIDIFPGEWLKPLANLKLNSAYTYTEQAKSDAKSVQQGSMFSGQEICDNGRDDDNDGAVDCLDTDCSLEAACLIIGGISKTHRVYGSADWDTPGKLQAEVYADLRTSVSGPENTLRATRQEYRSYLTWRPIQPSPITLRFDVLKELSRPEKYDNVRPLVEPKIFKLEPALEWRRRWSAKWWHLAKVSVTHFQYRDQPHIKTADQSSGLEGDLERMDFNSWEIKPSLEVRRRIEDEKQGRWSLRPYLRLGYSIERGRGVRSRVDEKECEPDAACFVDGSKDTNQFTSSLGLLWIQGEHVFVDLDLTGIYKDCRRAASGKECVDQFIFTPQLLATVRY